MAAHRFEGVADGNVDVLMAMGILGIAGHHHFFARHRQHNFDVIQLALVVAPVARLDHDLAVGYAVEILLKFVDFLLDALFDSVGTIKISE